MILMPQILDVIANENASYKRNELEFKIVFRPKRIQTVQAKNPKSIVFLFVVYEDCAIITFIKADNGNLTKWTKIYLHLLSLLA